jgi:serine/threonine protein kinase
MRRIVDDRWPVKYPPYMSPAAKDLIMRLLERKPAKRIGMLQGRTADIKSHKWFAVGPRHPSNATIQQQLAAGIVNTSSIAASNSTLHEQLAAGSITPTARQLAAIFLHGCLLSYDAIA